LFDSRGSETFVEFGQAIVKDCQGKTRSGSVKYFVVEFDDVSESDLVRQRLFSLKERWRDQLTQLVNEAIASGQFRRDLDVDQFVWELCGIYLNHHASHRLIREKGGQTGRSPQPVTSQ
jgi:hypothetical protein